MKKIFIFIAVIAIILLLIIFAIRENFNFNKIISEIEEKNDLTVTLHNESIWNYYPSIKFNNNVTIKDNADFFLINKADIDISKKYWPASPIDIILISPSINFENLQFHDTIVKSTYKNKKILFNSISSNLVEGNIVAQGEMGIENDLPFKFNGSFENISLNMLMNQTKTAKWERVKIKISSKNFNFSGIAKKNKNLIKKLKGDLPINGSVFFVSTDEERFGVALLSLLADKLPDLSSMSNAVNFLITKFSNIPSSISGTLIIKEGLISTEDMLIENNRGYASLTATLDLETTLIDGKINFFEGDEVYIEASLKGSLNNPQILIGGKVFIEEDSGSLRDIKKIFEDGINSLVERLLKADD